MFKDETRERRLPPHLLARYFGLGVQSTASCCHVTYTSFSGAVCMICRPELVHSEEFVADLAAKAQLDHVIH